MGHTDRVLRALQSLIFEPKFDDVRGLLYIDGTDANVTPATSRRRPGVRGFC